MRSKISPVTSARVPDKLGQEQLRQYQLHLVHDCKLTVETISGRISAIRFFFVKVLRRGYREVDLVYPKRPERLPVILSEEEVALTDVDSQRMVIHVRQGKGK